MKHKLINTILVGLLAAVLYTEAVVIPKAAAVSDVVGSTEAAGLTETAGSSEAAGLSEAAGASGAVSEAAGASETAAAGTAVESGRLTLAGGIGAVLSPSGSSAVESSGQDSPESVSVPDGSAIPDAAQEGAGRGAERSRQQEQAESEYAGLAIADVQKYVNVRSGPDTGSAIVGHIYNGAVAHVLETVAGEDGEWFRIVSGSVEGYIKSEFFFYGDAAAEVIDRYVTKYAVVLADRLNVRKEPGLEAGRIGYVDKGEKVRLLEDLGEWLKVQYTADTTGYVAAEYVTVTEEFVYAKTIEEVEAELAAKRALEQRRKVSEVQAAENTTVTAAPPGAYSTNDELRSQIVAYAMQFLGKPYVHGGRSLETGTDCSGFTSLIYAQFGYSLSRTPEGQLAGTGRNVSYSEARPGDIVCYGTSRCTHVAMYIGDGQIIHSANPRKGVVAQAGDFDNIMAVKSIVD